MNHYEAELIKFCNITGVTPEEIKSKRRFKRVVFHRDVYIWFMAKHARNECKLSGNVSVLLSQIAKVVNMERCNIYHSVAVIRELRKYNKDVRSIIKTYLDYETKSNA